MTKEELIKESEAIKKEIEQLNGLKEMLMEPSLVDKLEESRESGRHSRSYQSSSERKGLTYERSTQLHTKI